MEQQNNQQQSYKYGQMPQQESAPYSVITLVMGILSLLSGCVGAGLVFGILGVVFGNKGMAAFSASPASYKGKGILTAGRVMSILGIVFGALSVVGLIISTIIGAAYFEWLFDLMDLF